jgi:hypothetical protein
MCAGEGGFEASQVSHKVEATAQQGVACDTLRNSESVTEVSQAIVQGPKSKVQSPKSSPGVPGPRRQDGIVLSQWGAGEGLINVDNAVFTDGFCGCKG